MERSVVWSRVRSELNTKMPHWQERLAEMGQLEAIEKRDAGYVWKDEEVFKGLVLSILSNSTDWSRVQAILPELHVPFEHFDLHSYGQLGPEDVVKRLIPWFKARKAGSPYQRRSFTLLIEATRRLIERAESHGSVNGYLDDLFVRCGRQPVDLAKSLGTDGPHKVSGCGIPLAAEFLRNIGHDAAKPDRHICRAVGSFGWVRYSNWSDRSGNKAPFPSENEMVKTMRILESLSEEVGERTALIDGALWLLCAKSGLSYTNDALGQLVAGDETTENADIRIQPSRADRFTWRQEDVVYVSDEESARMLDEMYGKGNRPGVNGFMGNSKRKEAVTQPRGRRASNENGAA